MTTTADVPSAYGELAAVKAASGVRVSVCIPARDEAATVAAIVAPVLELIHGPHRLVDEVIVADDGSTDGTGDIVYALGAAVIRRVAPHGKGAAMADAVRMAHGEIIIFLDADVTNFGTHFVVRLLAPLLTDEAAMLVKGAYRRSLDGVADEGGRVTELLARPLLERLFPDLAFVRQPLAGEVAVRRCALDRIVLEPGYGVEVGMLIDVFERHGAGAVRQVDLGERAHRNRPLAELSIQARQIVAAVLDRAGPRIRATGEAR